MLADIACCQSMSSTLSTTCIELTRATTSILHHVLSPYLSQVNELHCAYGLGLSARSELRLFVGNNAVPQKLLSAQHDQAQAHSSTDCA